MLILKLEAFVSNDLQPKRIFCRDNSGKVVAVVFCDGAIHFSALSFPAATDQVMIVRDNWLLFWNNLEHKTENNEQVPDHS